MPAYSIAVLSTAVTTCNLTTYIAGLTPTLVTTQVTNKYNKQTDKHEGTPLRPVSMERDDAIERKGNRNGTQFLKAVRELVEPAAVAARDLQLKYTSLSDGVVRHCMNLCNLIIT